MKEKVNCALAGAGQNDFGLSDRRGLTQLYLLLKKAGETQRRGDSGGMLPLHGLEVAAQHLRPRGLAHIAHLDVQEQIHFPLRKDIAANIAGDQVLQELAERRPIRVLYR